MKNLLLQATILVGLTAPSWGVESLHFCAAPAVVPRETGLSSYSPEICVAYTGLEERKYTLRVHLIESQSGNFFCASDQLCPLTWRIDNSNGGRSEGQQQVVPTFEVQGYTSFIWVADLYNDSGAKVANATQNAVGVTNRAPLLHHIGGHLVGIGERLEISVSAVDAEGDPVRFSASSLPEGAEIDGATGKIVWQAATAGTFTPVISAVQTGPTGLRDSERIQIRVTDSSPASDGVMSRVAPLPVVPIHIHLLPNGKVMFWDRHHEAEGWDGTPHLLDPETGVSERITSPGFDLFCSGHTLMADGRLFIAGGHIDDGVGEPRAVIFDAKDNTWTHLPDMRGGRWYPSCTALPNGDIFVEAGTDTGFQDINELPEVWQGNWRRLTSVAAQHGGLPEWADFYPFSYAVGADRIFLAGPQQRSRMIQTRASGAVTAMAKSSLLYRDYGSSVMYDANRVLIVGGNPRELLQMAIFEPSKSAEVIDLGETNPEWRHVDAMSNARRHLTTTLLPDGTILATGGSSLPGFDRAAGAALHAELFDPSTEEWKLLAASAHYRGYHSVALLLPDARVLVAGGGHPSEIGEPAYPDYEIFSPPYLFQGQRPVIDAAPASLRYAEPFLIQTGATNVSAVNLIRLGSVTHGFDESQRICRLGAPASGELGLSVTAPASSDACQPGPYLLFLISDEGVPSTAKIVQLGGSPAPPTPSPSPSSTPTRVQVHTPSPSVTSTATTRPGPLLCAADCDNDGAVALTEVVQAIDIALARAARSTCPIADVGRDGTVHIEELVLAVTYAQSGCP